MLPLIVSGPVIVAPQIRTAAAPFATTGPVIAAALDVERPARRDRHRPGLAAAGADADGLAGRDVQRPRAAARSGTDASSATVSVPATNESNT